MTLLLVRHTAVEVPPGLCYGRTEVPLAPSFEAEAAAVRSALPPGPWRIHSSSSSRCQRLAASLGDPVQIDPRWRELDFGAWEGRLWQELPREATRRWLADFVNGRPPGGESLADVVARAEACLAEVLAERAERPIVVVTHGGVIRALLARARGMGLADAFAVPVAFGSIHAVPRTLAPDGFPRP